MPSSRDGRTRNWSFICYPESAPPNWRDILDALHVEWIESPLHEHDMNPDNTPKKPHWHILIMFDGNKSYEQVKEISDACNAPIPERVQSPKGLVRYMCHLDNPEKFQYGTELIIAHGGADVAALLKPTSAARYVLIKEMLDFIVENHVCYFHDFMSYAASNRMDDWFPLLCDNSAFVINSAIRSQRDAVRDLRLQTVPYEDSEKK